MRILFMGTPDFALCSLRALCQAGENVVGVVTQTDKPKGRGYVLTPPPVKVYAEEQGIPVFQPKTLRDGSFDETLEQLAPDLIIVVAYGKILPPFVLSFPRYGCINVHGSLLPAYRGAAPIQRALLDGCEKTGVTTMRMDDGVDTGDMLLRSEVPIGENDNFETLHDALAEAGAQTLLRTLAALRAGTLKPQKQPEEGVSHAAKIEKTDCELDFSAPAAAVHNRVRALSPFPLSFTHTPDGKLLKVTESRVREAHGVKGRPGEVLSLDGEILVACGEGSVALCSLIPEGKSRMNAADYIRGRKLSVGNLLT